MPFVEESSVAVSFDSEGTLMVRVLYERESPTRWLLVRAIPAHVTLSQALQCIESCGSPQAQETTSKPTELNSHSGANESVCSSVKSCAIESYVCVARVGYIPEENCCYCLLLQFASSSDAEHVKRKLLHADLVGSAPTLSEHVQLWAEVMNPRPKAPASGHIECKHGGATSKVSLETLCGLTRRGVICATPQSKGSGSYTQSSAEWPGSDDSSHIPTYAAPLAPTEEFCSICQEEIASGGRPFIVTLCKHMFHLACFGKHLEDVSPLCPLCRFSMASLESKCNVCGTHQDLWTCLVCGWVACGKGHCNDNLRHFESSGHSCAMQVSTSRIWNYSANTFLHHQLAIELGQEDDAKAALAAAADDASPGHCFGNEEGTVTASSYWRSRWWWDEKDEEAALDLNGEYVREYYMGVMEKLMEEQLEWFERNSGLGMGTCASLGGVWRKLQATESSRRRRIVSSYVTGMRRIELHDRLMFNRFLKEEIARNKSLRDELLLQSHTIQNQSNRISQTRVNIEKFKKRGAQQIALKEEELKRLQEKLESLMLTLE